jgi:hypothetical protein
MIPDNESMEQINGAMISHAQQIAQEIHASAILVYADVIKSPENLKNLIKETRCILASKREDVIADLRRMGGRNDRVVRVPQVDLTRLSP